MATYRAFEVTFRPSPKSRRRLTWSRCYVDEAGTDEANHAMAEEAVRREYPKAVIESFRPALVSSGKVLPGLVGQYVAYLYHGEYSRHLLGEVKGERQVGDDVVLDVVSFNGEAWPVSPKSSDVTAIG